MKKILSLILAGVMAVTGCVLGYAPVEAAPVQRNVRRSGRCRQRSIQRRRSTGADEGNIGSLQEPCEIGPGSRRSGLRIIDKWTFTQPEDVAEDAVDGLSSAKAKKKIAAGEEQVLNVVEGRDGSHDSTEQLVKELEANDDVEIAEPNYIVRACNVDDTYFGYQWGLKNTRTELILIGEVTQRIGRMGQGKYRIGQGRSCRGLPVSTTAMRAVENSMWKNTHQPDLRGEYGFDFANRDNDPMDDNGHGTHCAGIIGAVGSNGTGISGVNRSVQSIPALKTLLTMRVRAMWQEASVHTTI